MPYIKNRGTELLQPESRGHMPKTLTIQIRSADNATKALHEGFTTVNADRRLPQRDDVYFTSIEAARTILTPNRLAMLRTIKTKRPGSIYELSKIIGRDLKNVQGDLRLLERYGLIRLATGTRSGNRRVKVPQAVFDRIALKIAI